MPLDDLYTPLPLSRGAPMRNRFALAALTNLQSHDDGTLSDDEYRWLTLRAKGGYGLVLTCASHVQRSGQAYNGQLGVFADQHIEGLTRLAAGLRAGGSLSAVQLYHAGRRARTELTGDPTVTASDDPETGARGLTIAEVESLIESFVEAAVRADRAGFDGVEVHGAHGFILAQFLDPATNRRDDRYGGTLENRARVTFEVLQGIRRRCRPDFQLGLRLSPDRFGLGIAEARDLAAQLMSDGDIDYLDLSLWDVRKAPDDPAFKDRTMMDCFLDLPRGGVRVGLAGMIRTVADALLVRESGADFVLLGRAGILHHDLPRRLRAEPGFDVAALPVSEEHLRAEGLGERFVDYMRTWPGFVAEKTPQTA
ncbi:NADH:flavin oxidoreductase [Phenylobacterium sp.]|uniref:NADH:flavin oxidoreductase n=1 Tax=Phenylobacterium sp. TaxID=1871053 RepID=UPI00301CE415